MKKILTLVLTAAPLFHYAQVRFQKTFGEPSWDYAYSCKPTADGYIVAGSLNGDAYLLKLDWYGNKIWSHTYAADSVDEARSVQQTTDNGYILTGYTAAPTGQSNLYLLKTDSLGTLQWSKTFGDIVTDGNCVIQSSDGGFVAVGVTSSGGPGKIIVMKTDSAGNLIWSTTIGGTENDFGSFIQQTNDGGYIVTGSYSVGAFLLMKLNGSGVLSWIKSYENAGQHNGNCVRQTPDNGYIICGDSYDSTSTNIDVSLLKTDSTGTLTWAKTFNTTGIDNGNYIINTPSDNGYMIVGEAFVTSSDIYVIKTDAAGNKLWTSAYGKLANDEVGYSIELCSDNGYIIAGMSALSMDNDIYVVKTDLNGLSGCSENDPGAIEMSLTLTTTIPVVATTSVITAGTPATVFGTPGETETTVCTTGITAAEKMNSLLVYPNPSDGWFTISPVEIGSVITIFDLTGRILFSKKAESSEETFEPGLSAGIYVIRVMNDKNSISQDKLIVE